MAGGVWVGTALDGGGARRSASSLSVRGTRLLPLPVSCKFSRPLGLFDGDDELLAGALVLGYRDHGLLSVWRLTQELLPRLHVLWNDHPKLPRDRCRRRGRCRLLLLLHLVLLLLLHLPPKLWRLLWVACDRRRAACKFLCQALNATRDCARRLDVPTLLVSVLHRSHHRFPSENSGRDDALARRHQQPLDIVVASFGVACDLKLNHRARPRAGGYDESELLSRWIGDRDLLPCVRVARISP
mmetsp:Transcript_5184/g.12016  ORF Transcript_5184/g.12016 Transcript_5184/m.12016 type:complete len:242 (+) Transcript_5184:103-828(+)